MARFVIDKVKTGENIKNHIKNSEYSIEKIASLLELESPRVIYEWMRGRKKPSLESIYNLSIILNVSISDLVSFVKN